MIRRMASVLALATAVAAFAAAPALASLGDEVAAGRTVAERVDARTISCAQLTDRDLEHLGEYVMERMVGSRAAHQVMNDRMAAALGDANADRMHELLGRRYAGCRTRGTGAGMMTGTGMMGSGGGPAAGMGAIMSSANFGWMRDGAWRHMSRADWQRTGRDWMGPAMVSGAGGAWSSGAVLAAVLAALALGALAVFVAIRRPWRRRKTPGPAPT